MECHSYVLGFEASKLDVEMAQKLGDLGFQIDPKALPHLSRWVKHINSYTNEEKSQFPLLSNPKNQASESDIDAKVSFCVGVARFFLVFY